MNIKKLFLAAVLSLPMVAMAEGKIAVLSLQEAVLNTDVAQKRIEAMQAGDSYKGNKKELETIREEGRKLVEKLQKDQSIMSDEEKMQAQKSIQQKQADMEHVGRKLMEADQELAQRIFRELGPVAQQVVQELIKNEGIGLLLGSKDVMHADTSFNLTPKVTDKMNQALAK